MVAAVVLGEPREDALTAVRVLATVAVELVLPVRVLVAATVVLAAEVDIDAFVRRHDLGEVVLELVVLVRVHVALLAEVRVVVLTVLSRLTPT